MNKKKILFILPSLKAGGAERVVSFLAKNLDQNVFETKIAVVGFKKDAVYNIDNLDVTFFNQNRLFNGVYPLYKFIKIHKPDIVFGTIRHVNILLGFFNLIFRNVCFIVREASVISTMLKFSNSKQYIPSFLIKFLYNHLDAIVCQSNDIQKDLQIMYGLQKDKLVVINNPITIEADLPPKRMTFSNKIRFITIGRLSKEKGHQRILLGLKSIKNYDYSYHIIGDGPLKEEISEFAKTLGIRDKIEFISYTKDVSTYLGNSDFYLQGSYVEGFPNALLESCYMGTPAIAFNCPGGTKEILTPTSNGYLVNNEEEFKQTLELINVHNQFLRNEVRKSVTKKFSKTKILNEYQNLFLQLLK